MSRQDIVKKAPLSEGVPDGYEWTNPHYAYGDFVNGGWDKTQLIIFGHLKPVAQPLKEVYHTAVVKFDNYPKEYYYRISDTYYQLISGRKDVRLEVDVDGKSKVVELVRLIDSVCHDRATKDIKCVVYTGDKFSYTVGHDLSIDLTRTTEYYDNRIGSINQEIARLETKLNESKLNINQQEESQMSNVTSRKTVTVNLIDRDAALDEKYSVVANFGQFTTSKSPEALIRSIIIDPKNKVAELIAQHNAERVKQTNNEILNRTGNKVTLEPVEESDLYWEIQ